MNSIYSVREKLALLAGDAAVVYVSLVLACLVRFGKDFEFPILSGKPALFLILILYPMSLYFFDLYDINGSFMQGRYLVHFSWAMVSVAAVVIFVSYLLPYSIGRGLFVISFAFVALLFPLWRALYAGVHHKAFPVRNLLLLGTGKSVPELIRMVRLDRSFRIVGLLCEEGLGKDLAGVERLGDFGVMNEVIERESVSDIIIADDVDFDDATERALVNQRLLGRHIFDTVSFYELAFQRLPVMSISDEWFIKAPGFEMVAGRMYNHARRVMDIFLSCLLLALTSPLFAVIIVLQRCVGRGPVFYVQERLGRGRRSFRLIKFRTMVPDAEKGVPRWAEENDCRVTPLGGILRRARLDELPQLINVLKGDMSLIGPRPEREHFVRTLDKTIPFYSLRFFVKPGITGWAQVNFRYGGTAEDAVEKLRYELFYIKNMSPFLDLRILLKTARVCLFGLGSR